MIAVQHRPGAHNRRDGMLEDQLFLTVVLKQDGIFVKGAYFACEFDSADQVYRDRSLIFPDRIEKRVLNVLCRLIIHVPISLSTKVEMRCVKMLKLLQLLQSPDLSPNAHN
jgi:hypothetical protein